MSGDTEPHLWDDAACRGKDQHWWFPPLDSNGVTREILLAKGRKVCLEQCPRYEQCLDWSLAQTGELHGMWAGLTPRDRMLERRARRVVRTGRWSCEVCGQGFSDSKRFAGHMGHCRRGLGPPRRRTG